VVHAEASGIVEFPATDAAARNLPEEPANLSAIPRHASPEMPDANRMK
jgi:hypothetical protein